MKTADECDLARRPRTALPLWGVPMAALLVSVVLPGRLTVVVWPVGLAWMGVACLANATRCGRRHCYFTAPFYLLLAIVSLLYGVGLLPLGPSGWRWIGFLFLGGTLVLTCLPEVIWGRYVARRAISR